MMAGTVCRPTPSGSLLLQPETVLLPDRKAVRRVPRQVPQRSRRVRRTTDRTADTLACTPAAKQRHPDSLDTIRMPMSNVTISDVKIPDDQVAQQRSGLIPGLKIPRSYRLGTAVGATQQLVHQLCNVDGSILFMLAMYWSATGRLAAVRAVDQYEAQMIMFLPGLQRFLEQIRTELASLSETKDTAYVGKDAARYISGNSFGYRLANDVVTDLGVV